MPSSLLERVAKKVAHGERLDASEGCALFACTQPEELETIRQMADSVRARTVGQTVFFAHTLFIYPTNLCELHCPFCSFYAKPGWKSAWFSTPEQIEHKVREYYPKGVNEIHIVGGLWRDCNLDYYEEVFARIHAIDPELHIKALTAVEYHFLAELHGISVAEVFRKMQRFGLGSLPGGGAEVLVEEVRRQIAPGKISSDEYLEIHALAHSLGLSSNISLLFNHIETYEDIITHLCRVRELQDKTHGFKTFVPLKFGEENNALGRRQKRLKPKNIPLVYAVARLMLDNIPHIKALWNYVGVDVAVDLLHWGANDLSSTNLEEKVISMAGGVQVRMDRACMEHLIEQAGRTPKLIHSGLVCSP